MMKPDDLICVTGATGFVASQLIKQLLERGQRVRGTVRSLRKAEALAPLESLPGAKERLSLVEADLLNAASLIPAVDGCGIVMHTASPYIMSYKDPQRELVDPAVNGTRHTLGACQAVSSVRRVVLTSSMAAITDEPPDRVLTEEDWNEESSLTRNAYYYSKTMAERAAWAFMAAERPRFDLVVVNPFMVIGPSLVPPLNESNKLIADILNRRMPAILSLAWGFVDVRDVAGAHILAATKPLAKGRHVCANLTLTMAELVDHLRPIADGYKLPRLSLDNAFGRAMTRMSGVFYPKGARDFMSTHLGRVPRFDHTKIERELGLAFTDIDVTLKDTVQDLARWGHVKQ